MNYILPILIGHALLLRLAYHFPIFVRPVGTIFGVEIIALLILLANWRSLQIKARIALVCASFSLSLSIAWGL